MTRGKTDWPVKKFTKNNSLFSKLLCLQWAPSFFLHTVGLIQQQWNLPTMALSSFKNYCSSQFQEVLCRNTVSLDPSFPSFIEFSSIETFLFPVYVLHTDSHVWFHASLPSYTHTLCTVCTHIQHIHDLRTNTHWHDLEVSDSHPGTVVLKVVVFSNIDSISLLFDAAFGFESHQCYYINVLFTIIKPITL